MPSFIYRRTDRGAQYNADGQRRSETDQKTDSSFSTAERAWKRSRRTWHTRLLKWTNRFHKLRLRAFSYDGARIDKLLSFLVRSQREAFHTNPYNLSSVYYLLLFAVLAFWAIGSIVAGHLEAQLKLSLGQPGYLIPLGKGLIGAAPALVQITLFLFPPLYVLCCVGLLSSCALYGVERLIRRTVTDAAVGSPFSGGLPFCGVRGTCSCVLTVLLYRRCCVSKRRLSWTLDGRSLDCVTLYRESC